MYTVAVNLCRTTLSIVSQYNLEKHGMKWMGFYAIFVHIQGKLGQKNLPRMVRWMRWNCPPYMGFEIQTWRSETEHATYRSQRLSTILNLYEWAGKKHLKLEGQSGVQTRDLRFSKQAALPIASGPLPNSI